MLEAPSLQDLRDITEPPPVPWWPPAVGWWILAGFLAAVAGWWAFRAFSKWRSNAYRRAALRELTDASTLVDLDRILKRTALCAFPRMDVASLSGRAWPQWLSKTADGNVPSNVAAALADGVFDGRGEQELQAHPEVAAFAADWIRHHHRGDA